MLPAKIIVSRTQRWEKTRWWGPLTE